MWCQYSSYLRGHLLSPPTENNDEIVELKCTFGWYWFSTLVFCVIVCEFWKSKLLKSAKQLYSPGKKFSKSSFYQNKFPFSIKTWRQLQYRINILYRTAPARTHKCYILFSFCYKVLPCFKTLRDYVPVFIVYWEDVTSDSVCDIIKTYSDCPSYEVLLHYRRPNNIAV